MFRSATNSPGGRLCWGWPPAVQSPRQPLHPYLFTRRRLQTTDANGSTAAVPGAQEDRQPPGTTDVLQPLAEEHNTVRKDQVKTIAQYRRPPISSSSPSAVTAPTNPQVAARQDPLHWGYRKVGLGRRRNSPNTADTVDLGTQALGQPAKIRIIRQESWKVPDKQAETENIGVGKSTEELADMVWSKSQEVTGSTDPMENLNHLRDKFLETRPLGGYFRRSQCAAVAKKMKESYTASQLSSYLKAQKVGLGIPHPVDLEQAYAAEQLTRSQWFGGQSQFPEAAILRLDSRALNDPLDPPHAITTEQLESFESLSKKGKLVERILRQAWKVREREEAAYGELDIRIGNMEALQVLLKHHDEVFRQRADKYGVRIEISENDSIVRIAGEYGVCADTYSLILRDIERVASQDIWLSELLDGATDVFRDTAQRFVTSPAYRAQVEHLTKTVVVPTQSPRPQAEKAGLLRVCYLGPEQTAYEDARRLISQATEIKNAEDTHVQCDLEDSKDIPLEVPIEPGSLSLRERYTNWSRWVYSMQPTNRSQSRAASSGFETVYSPALGRDFALSAARHLFQAWSPNPALAARDTSYWAQCETRQLSAFVGYLAHPTKSTLNAEMGSSGLQPPIMPSIQDSHTIASFRRMIESPRNLLTGMPNLWARLNTLVVRPPAIYNRLIVRLKPSRTHELVQRFRSLPELELLFHVDDTARSTTLHSARLVRAWRESDLLLPAQATDLRFVARSLVSSTKQTDPAIRNFIHDSHLDAFGDGRLQTPARMVLSVPRYAFEAPGATAARSSGPTPHADPAEAEAEAVTVEYCFASLEYLSGLSAQYQGHAVVYGTVEAGRTGGRREELRFDLADLSITDVDDGAAAGRQRYLDWFDGVREFNARLLH